MAPMDHVIAAQTMMSIWRDSLGLETSWEAVGQGLDMISVWPVYCC